MPLYRCHKSNTNSGPYISKTLRHNPRLYNEWWWLLFWTSATVRTMIILLIQMGFQNTRLIFKRMVSLKLPKTKIIFRCSITPHVSATLEYIAKRDIRFPTMWTWPTWSKNTPPLLYLTNERASRGRAFTDDSQCRDTLVIRYLEVVASGWAFEVSS